MERKTVVFFNLLLLVILASACSASSPLDYWTEQALEQLAYAGLIPDDAIARGLSRMQAAKLVAAVAEKADQSFEPETLELLGQLLAKFQGELASTKIQLEDLRQRVAQAREGARERQNRISTWSEARGIVEITPGNGGNPRVFNAVRIRPLGGDGKTRLSFMLYMQNALGSTSDNLTVYQDEFSFSTQLLWGTQPINLVWGNFWLTTTPFTIYRPFRQEDLQKESRRSFNGVRVQTKALGLNWQSFLSRITDGKGSGFDRYLFYNSTSAPLRGGETTLTLMRTWDDLTSSSRTQGALSSTTVGLSFRKQGSLWNRGYELSGEGNVNFLDQDVYDTAIATTEFAARLTGSLQLAVPANFNYYAISDLYPTGNTAIQTIKSDFVYQYEDNPWEPYYIANVQRLEVKTGELRLGNWLRASALWNGAQELFPTGDSPKAFSYLGAELHSDLEKFLPSFLMQSQKLNFTVGSYKTSRQHETNLEQKVGSASLSQRVLNNLDLEVGYEVYNLVGTQAGEERQELSQVPFVELNWKPLASSNLEWLIQSRRDWKDDVCAQQWRHKVRWYSTIGPSTRLEVRYDLAKSGATDAQNISINYRSGF